MERVWLVILKKIDSRYNKIHVSLALNKGGTSIGVGGIT